MTEWDFHKRTRVIFCKSGPRLRKVSNNAGKVSHFDFAVQQATLTDGYIIMLSRYESGTLYRHYLRPISCNSTPISECANWNF
jgi:hypothetical protein